MRDVFSLEGKTILITGASSGIGRAIAIAVSEKGGKVIVCARNAQKLTETISKLHGDGHNIIAADITSNDDIAALIAGIDKIDGVVHSAGIMGLAPLKFAGNDMLDSFVRLNLEGPVKITRSLVKGKKLRQGASIVFITSVSGGVVGAMANSIYSTTKAAITGFSQAISLEVGGAKMRSNCIAPGMIKTEAIVDVEDNALSDADFAADKLKYPLGDYGTPEDVANGCLYLLSDASKWVTGTTLVIDGGYTAQ